MGLPVMFAAMVMMAPLDPGADQVALKQLFKDGVDTAFVQRPPERNGVVRIWMGATCLSIIGVREPSGANAAYRLFWSEAAIVPTSDDLVVAVSGFKPAEEQTLEHPTLFRFRDAQTAETARLAMTRLKAACTPPR